MRSRPAESARQIAVDLMLDGKLDEFVRSRRAEQPPRSWRLIARDLWEAIGVDVTHETLRAWYPEDRRK